MREVETVRNLNHEKYLMFDYVIGLPKYLATTLEDQSNLEFGTGVYRYKAKTKTFMQVWWTCTDIFLYRSRGPVFYLFLLRFNSALGSSLLTPILHEFELQDSGRDLLGILGLRLLLGGYQRFLTRRFFLELPENTRNNTLRAISNKTNNNIQTNMINGGLKPQQYTLLCAYHLAPAPRPQQTFMPHCASHLY